ncbi:MAG: NAD(P)/FAD-dependent oxidoreductase [Bacillota bacterium]
METGQRDLIITGAGPAGMTAAVFAGRKGIDTLLLSINIGGQVNWAAAVENYMGFKEINGMDLMSRFKEQMKGPHVRFQEDKVVVIQKTESFFQVETERSVYRSRSVLLATGKRPRLLHVPGEQEFRGRGVSYCSTCDAPLFRNLSVAVAGGGNSAMQAVLDLTAAGAKEIHLLLLEPPNADSILLERIQQIPRVVWHDQVRILEIQGDKMVKKVILHDTVSHMETSLDIEGVFIEIGLAPNSEPVKNLTKLNGRREVEVDCRCQTDVEGLMAAGDVTNVQEKQIVVASGEGAKAALSAANYLIYGRRLPAEQGREAENPHIPAGSRI